jgi:outer membrane protein
MKYKFLYAVLSLLLLFSTAYSADLMDIYKEALDNDPTFKEAYDTYMSSSEAIPQARAALYPQVTIDTYTGRNVEDVLAGVTRITQTFGSVQWQISATQAIFNFEAWSRVQQAKASVRAAQATFNDAAQNLILRTSQAYFDILFAKDTLVFAEAKKRANKRQLHQAQERFNVGVDTITSVYEAKAAYDQSVAEVISAKNNQINQNENLRKLTNHVYDVLASLRNSQIPLIKPEPNNVDEWILASLKQNYNLNAVKNRLDASKENINAESASSWPVFFLQGNGSKIRNTVNNNVGNFFVPARQSAANLGVAMNFPLIQGGYVQSKIRQAQFDYQSSYEVFQRTYRDVTVNSRIAFNTIIDGISKVKADRQTVISQKNSLDSTEAQFQVGTRTMVDVTTAQQRLFEAQRQLAQDQYNLINATLYLKYQAGSLNVNDLQEVNTWLNTTRISGFPPPK